MALISQRCNRPKARPLGSPQNSVDNLALNEPTEKRNILGSVQQLNEPAACTEQFNRGLTRSHRWPVGRCLRYLNVLSAEELPDNRHFKLEQQAEKGDIFTRFDHLADDRQIDRRQ